MVDYVLALGLFGVPIALFLMRMAAVIALGYEIEATLWSMPI